MRAHTRTAKLVLLLCGKMQIIVTLPGNRIVLFAFTECIFFNTPNTNTVLQSTALSV